MFIGHFGLGFAAKTVAPQVSLGTLFLASLFVDLLWPIFLMSGLESVNISPGATKMMLVEFSDYPFSHSLLAVFIWSVLFALVYFVCRRSVLSAIVCAGLVIAHWFMDALVHAPDLLLIPGGTTRVGFGLWNSPSLAIGLELMIFAVGLFLYLRATKANNRCGLVSFWSMSATLIVIYIGNIFGPPPPSVSAIAWVSLLQWLFIPWGYFIDRNRQSVC